jgi:nitroreductase
MNAFTFLRSLARLISGKARVAPSLRENQTLKLILQRRSVRSFSNRPVPDEIFQAILEAGRLAPSTVNLQSWSFAIFSADGWKEKFGRTIPFKAQRAVIILGDMHRVRTLMPSFPESPMVDFATVVMNASLAAMNMNLAAEALGISSVMLSETGRSGLLDAAYLCQTLGLPEKVFPITTIVFGYPAGAYPPMPPKLPLETICFEGSYREADPGVMQDWLNQMSAGYKASHLNSSFEAQLKIYQNKLDSAETGLNQLVFGAAGNAQSNSETDSLHV